MSATAWPAPPPTPVPSLTSGSTLPVLPTVVEEGDPAFAYGSLFETGTPSNALLCAWAGGWPPDVGCIGRSRAIPFVAVSNVNVRDLPGTEADPNVPELPKGT